MKVSRLFGIVLPALLTSGSALAWGAPGHQFIGALADRLLNDHARREVADILGFDLKTAATWPDCVRAVKKTMDGQFRLEHAPQHPEYTKPCTAFDSASEEARMQDYAARNWDNCNYEPRHGCHESYHFADIAEQRGKYADDLTGANPHDVAHAINAAALVLQGRPAPSPFSIKDKKEALLMIAHFVGDLHQPLHVGAVYLDSRGRLADPDQGGMSASQIEADMTRGGNSILLSGRRHAPNLHAQWDEIPAGLKNGPSQADIAAAREVPKTGAPVSELAAHWASDTVTESQKAFADLSFRGAGQHHWTAKFADHAKYDASKADLQHKQLIKAGAHLAELLNDLWP